MTDEVVIILIVAGALFAIGIGSLIARGNLIKMVIGLEFLGKGVSLLFVLGGFLSGDTGVSQAVVFTLIAIEAVVAGLALDDHHLDDTILDPLLAMAVALNIVWTSVQLVRRSVAGLMDAALPEAERRSTWARTAPTGTTWGASPWIALLRKKNIMPCRSIRKRTTKSW